jgi:hypothetical protein
MFQTEFDFTLPCGYIDAEGTLHRTGVMRRATAADEVLPLNDPRVAKNPAYLAVILLSRVVIRLDGVAEVTPKVVEGFFATDLAYLQALYNRINGHADGQTEVTCPECRYQFSVETVGAGG